jgi:O-methyltransferase
VARIAKARHALIQSIGRLIWTISSASTSAFSGRIQTMKPRKVLAAILDAIYLGGIARSLERVASTQARHVKELLRPYVLSGWKPLVPANEYTACCRNAIQALRRYGPDREIGDYLEFGVSRGTSLASMHKALLSEDLPHVRLFGFDSFLGLPPESTQQGGKKQGWEPGNFMSSLSATRRYLSHNGVDLRRVQLVKGWFKDTLTPETKDRLHIAKASLVMVDCDIYSASREALWFCEPLVQDRAVFFFDDWGWRSDIGELGQKEAFDEFLLAFPQLSAEPLPAYLPQARVFLVTRRVGSSGSNKPPLP